MDNRIPETVILDMQKRAYERKDEMIDLLQELKAAEASYANKKKEYAYKEKELLEVLSFLQRHNRNCHDSDSSWFEEFGYDLPVEFQPQAPF